MHGLTVRTDQPERAGGTNSALEDAVRHLLGVRGVTNNIAVTNKQVRAQDVKEKIEAVLSRNAELDAKRSKCRPAMAASRSPAPSARGSSAKTL